MFSIKPTPVLIDRQGQTGYWNGCGMGKPRVAQGNVVRVAENLPGISCATPLYSLLIIQGKWFPVTLIRLVLMYSSKLGLAWVSKLD